MFSKTQEGRFLVEMIAVLAIIGVLSVAGLDTTKQSMDKAQDVQGIGELEMLVAGIVSRYNFAGDFSELSPQSMVKAGIVSRSRLSDDGNAISWSLGDIYVGPVAKGKGFYVEVSVPLRHCIQIASSGIGQGVVKEIRINEQAFYSFPLAVSSAADSCSYDENVITMYFVETE